MEGSAQSLLTETKELEGPEEQSVLARAIDFLETLLSNGPLCKNEIEKRAKDAGFKDITLRRAKAFLGAKEVGSYLTAGLTAKQIAKRLNISFHTVEGYQRTLKRKLRSKNSYQSGYLLRELLGSDSFALNQEKTEAVGLNKPVQPKLVGTVNKNLEQGKSKVNQGKTQFNDERSKEFSKYQSDQKEITQKILD